MSIPLQPETVGRVTAHDRLVAVLAVLVASRMRKHPLGEFCEWLEDWSRHFPPAGEDLAGRYRNAVCVVSLNCRGQQGCVLRSLAVAAACRLSRRSVTWCTGFAAEPFRAHAWVEADGRPVGEPAEVSDYTITRSSLDRWR